MKIGFVTCETLPELDEDNRLIYDYLNEKKENVSIVVWSDSSVDYKQFSFLIIRSLWDYVENYKEFTNWLHKMKSENIRIYNPIDLITWNSHKKYLIDLETHGVPIVPSIFCKKNTSLEDLKELLKSKKWKKFVFKPCVGNDSKGVFLVDNFDDLTQEKETQIIELSKSEDFLIQEFQSSIFNGEISLIYFHGEFSHSILRKPGVKDEFRQYKFEASLYKETQELIELGNKTMECLVKCTNLQKSEILYARIDLMKSESNNEKYHISEIELFEPTLFFSLDGPSIQKFSNSILTHKK
eukprot:gene11126-3945_t